MGIQRRKMTLLGLPLIIIEWIIFAGLSWFLQIETKEMYLFSAIYFLILVFYRHYRFLPSLIWQEIVNMLHAHILYGVLSSIISIYLGETHIIKLAIIILVMYCVTILVGRGYRLAARGRFATRILVLGAGKSAEEIEEVFKTNRFMFVKPLAYVDLGSAYGEKLTERKRILEKVISVAELDAFINDNKIDEAFIVDDALTKDQLESLTEYLHNKIPVIRYKPVLTVVQPYNTEIVDFDGNLFVSITDAKKNAIDVVLKKMIDLAAGIAGCLLLIPLTIYVKVRSLSYGDKESIFFTQNRIGIDGKIIKIYKYRSMVPNAEQILEELMEKDPKIREEYLTNKKLDPDPRVTPLGAFLRKTSLDEMPQFINVLKGDMSLIGPRPYLPREIDDMGKYYKTIIKSKPGITGMWQANGRSDVGFADRCKLDDYYYNNWSIWLDVIIIVKTIKAVLRHDGAV